MGLEQASRTSFGLVCGKAELLRQTTRRCIIAVVLMVVVALGLFLYFKQKSWFD